MKVKLDLHVHSEASVDGRMSLDEITLLAKERGLDGVALCDHDIVYCGITEKNGVLVIPGVEISTEYGHLLGLFVGETFSHRNFERTAQAIRASGGVTVMAHPFQRSRTAERLIPILPFLDGIEVWNGRADRKNSNANAMAEEFAKTHALPEFAGSDAHLPEEIGNGILILEVEERTLSSIRASLLSGERSVTGQRGRALDVARSQHTKLKKQNADPMQYIKWGAFALKCAFEDRKRK